MEHKERITILLAAVGVVIAACACIAAWLVVPQIQRVFSIPPSATIIPSSVVELPTSEVVTPSFTVMAAKTNTTEPTNTIFPTTTPVPQVSLTPTISFLLPFSDNFDNGINLNWREIAGTWRTVNGRLIADAGNRSEIIVGDENWKNYIIEVDVYSASAAGFPVGVIVRSKEGKYLMFKTDCCDTDWILIDGPTEKSIAHVDEGGLDFKLSELAKNHIRVEVIDQVFTGYIDGKQFLRVTDSTIPTGMVGLMSKTPHENRLLFDNFIVTLP